MNTSNNDNDSGLTLATGALAPGEPVVKTASRPVGGKRHALLLGTPEQEEAARTFATERDEASFKVLYVGAQKPMTTVVRQVGLRSEEVQEVVGVARDIIWDYRKYYQGETYGDFVVHAVAAARREARERQEEEENSPIALTASEECFGEEAIDPGQSPEESADALEAYGRLSPQEQKVVRMRAEGSSDREIAMAIGCKTQSVREIYRGAVERMRQMLK